MGQQAGHGLDEVSHVLAAPERAGQGSELLAAEVQLVADSGKAPQWAEGSFGGVHYAPSMVTVTSQNTSRELPRIRSGRVGQLGRLQRVRTSSARAGRVHSPSGSSGHLKNSLTGHEHIHSC